MTEQSKPTFVFELGEKGGHLEFADPNEVLQWFDAEQSKWHWMNKIPETNGALRSFASLRQAAAQFVQQWTQNQSNPEVASKFIVNLNRYIHYSWKASLRVSCIKGKLNGQRACTARRWRN